MTDSGYRHLVLVIDRSGSMRDHADGYSGPTKAELANVGLADFLAEAKRNPLRTTVSLYQFDHNHDVVADFAGLNDETLRHYKLQPRGWTALLDAVGQAITDTGERLGNPPEDQRPCEVTVVVVTDGHENASQEYKLAQIRDMISHQRDVYGWRFVY